LCWFAGQIGWSQRPFNADCDGFKRIEESQKSHLPIVLTGIFRFCSGHCSLYFFHVFFSACIAYSAVRCRSRRSPVQLFLSLGRSYCRASCSIIDGHDRAPALCARRSTDLPELAADVAVQEFNKRVTDAPFEWSGFTDRFFAVL
jgi:hypothetical protein